MEIKLIYAHAQGGVIGLQGDMPWERALPEDLAHFKSLTWGQTVIMGRKTWDSLPPAYRPLPGRTNIVLSRNPSACAEGAEVCTSLTTAVEGLRRKGVSSAWVIGGAEVYREALPLATEVVATEIDASYAGDAFAPTLEPADWRMSVMQDWQRSPSGLRYRFVRYQRNHPLS